MQKQEQIDGFQKTIQQINSQVFLTDLFHILYLKPFQCILDENKGGLPKGLKFVHRKNQIQYQIKPFQPIMSYQKFNNLTLSQKKLKCSPPQPKQNSYPFKQQKTKQVFPTYLTYLKQANGDNLLAQMKTHGIVQIAICICMYNQDRSMLNNTLQGVGQNIINLYRQGVDPDKIIVIVLQDGIQKMDSSILQLFQVLQTQSGMRFGVDKQKNLQESLQKISHYQTMKSKFGWEGQQFSLNLNEFLFNKQQQQEREALRFINVKRQYDQVNKLLKQVDALMKKKNITHEDLPGKVLQFFKIQCKKSRVGNIQDDLTSAFVHKKYKKQTQQQNLDKYYKQVTSQSLNVSKPLIQNALTKARQFCKQYINSRLQMSHVSFFRTSQFFPELNKQDQQQLDESKIQQSKNQITQQNIALNNKSNVHLKLDQNTNYGKKYLEDMFSIKMNLFFVIKYKNAQKLSSHNWFFNGFCKQFSKLQKVSLDPSPKYTILLDVGLRPQGQALCKMYNTMQNHQQIGGVCGYMGLKLQRQDPSANQLVEKLDFFTGIFLNFVDIQRAQQLEYNFAHLIDKGFQSIFKFIHVLPGAFSGYNMKAIWGDSPVKTDKLLGDYFKSIGDKVKDEKYEEDNISFWGIIFRVLLPNFILKLLPMTKVSKKSHQHLMYQSNVYLAEDRILCMGIHKNGYELRFLPDAYSFVDPVKDIPSLMGQRKRWINGSFFAFQKVSDQFNQLGCCQLITLQLWYLSFMNTLAYVAPGFFLFSISVAMQAFKADVLVKFFADSIPQDSQIYNAFVYTINFIYALLIFGLIYFSMSLTNRNQRFVRFVYGVSTILGIMSVIMLIILVVDLIRGLGNKASYLIDNQNPSFIQQIPGGQSTIDIIRYIVLGIMGLYALPLIFYSIVFCNIRIIFQILAGAISFAFYTPTYLIILNVYALCRMDDLSWGTKGLDAGSGKDKDIQNSWKIIKTVHVGKLLFWNILVAGLLIHFGSNYLLRFWLTLALMIIIAVTMVIKVVLALAYYIYYKVCIKTTPKVQQGAQRYRQTVIPSLTKLFKPDQNTKSKLQLQLREDIKNNIKNLQKQSGLDKDQVSLAALQMFSYLQVPGKSSKNNKNIGASISKIVLSVQKKSAMFKSKGLLNRKANKNNLFPLAPKVQKPHEYTSIHNKNGNDQESSQNQQLSSPQKTNLIKKQPEDLVNGGLLGNLQTGVNNLFTGGNKVKKTAQDFKNPGMNIKKK